MSWVFRWLLILKWHNNTLTTYVIITIHAVMDECYRHWNSRSSLGATWSTNIFLVHHIRPCLFQCKRRALKGDVRYGHHGYGQRPQDNHFCHCKNYTLPICVRFDNRTLWYGREKKASFSTHRYWSSVMTSTSTSASKNGSNFVFHSNIFMITCMQRVNMRFKCHTPLPQSVEKHMKKNSHAHGK